MFDTSDKLKEYGNGMLVDKDAVTQFGQDTDAVSFATPWWLIIFAVLIIIAVGYGAATGKLKSIGADKKGGTGGATDSGKK